MSIDGKIKIDGELWCNDFREHNCTAQSVVEYIAKTKITPIVFSDTCLFLKSAFEQAHHDDIKDLNGYVQKGCFFCGGVRQYIPCKSYITSKNYAIYNQDE